MLQLNLPKQPLPKAEPISTIPISQIFKKTFLVEVGLAETFLEYRLDFMAKDISGFEGYNPPVFINSNVMLFAEFRKLLDNAYENNELLQTLCDRMTGFDSKAR